MLSDELPRLIKEAEANDYLRAAAIQRAKRDGKDPMALTNDEKTYVWQTYLYNIVRENDTLTICVNGQIKKAVAEMMLAAASNGING